MITADSAALYALGTIKIGAGQPVLGTVLLQRAVSAQPNCADAHCNLGKALDDAIRPEKALASFERA